MFLVILIALTSLGGIIASLRTEEIYSSWYDFTLFITGSVLWNGGLVWSMQRFAVAYADTSIKLESYVNLQRKKPDRDSAYWKHLDPDLQPRNGYLLSMCFAIYIESLQFSLSL